MEEDVATGDGPEQELTKQKEKVMHMTRKQTDDRPPFLTDNRENGTCEKRSGEVMVGFHLQFKCHPGYERFLQELTPSSFGLVKTKLLSKW